jgi:hypothetical protein
MGCVSRRKWFDRISITVDTGSSLLRTPAGIIIIARFIGALFKRAAQLLPLPLSIAALITVQVALAGIACNNQALGTRWAPDFGSIMSVIGAHFSITAVFDVGCHGQVGWQVGCIVILQQVYNHNGSDGNDCDQEVRKGFFHDSEVLGEKRKNEITEIRKNF